MAKNDNVNGGTIIGSSALHRLSLFITMFIFWMVMAGRTELKFIIYGLITAAVTTWVTYPLLLVPNKDGSKKYFIFGFSIFKFAYYSCWLMWQMVLANVDVLLATTSQELQINPKLIRFRFKTDNPVTKVILANSITLTPGTVTLDVDADDVFVIHALTDGAAAGVVDGGMQKMVGDLMGEEYEFEVIEGA